MFQSTYLYKVRLTIEKTVASRTRFQSTYLYKVRLGETRELRFIYQVSIHVPI